MATEGKAETIPIKADSQAGMAQTARLGLIYSVLGRGKEYFGEAFKQVTKCSHSVRKLGKNDREI